MAGNRTGLLLTLVLAACSTPPTVAPRAVPLPPWTTMQRVQSPPSVWTLATRDGAWLYGDSLTVAGGAQVARLVHATTGRQVAVDANSGIPTRPAVDRLAVRVAQRGAPRVLVMATGANDALDPAGAAGVGGEAARVRDLVGPTTRVVWVAVLVDRPKHAGPDAAGTATVNSALRAAEAAGVVDKVAPWDAVLTRAGVGQSTRDGIHPVGYGVVLWATTVADSTTQALDTPAHRMAP